MAEARDRGNQGHAAALEALNAEVSACRRCPRLVEWRERTARRAARPLPRRALLGAAAARLRRPGGADPRSSAWRRPPTAATAPAGCSPATDRATSSSAALYRDWTADHADVRAPRRRPDASRGVRITRRRPLRPAGQQADARRARRLPAVPRPGARPARPMRVVVALGAFALGRSAPGAGRRSASRSRGHARGSATARRRGSARYRCWARSTRASRTPSPGD